MHGCLPALPNLPVSPAGLGAVPCLRRAAAVEEYGEKEEQEVEADEEGEGWLTADQSSAGRAAAGTTTTNAEGFEEIPDVEEEAGGGEGGGVADAAAASASDGGAAGPGGDEDVPDIDDLDLEDEEEEDEVGAPGTGGEGEALMWRSVGRSPAPSLPAQPAGCGVRACACAVWGPGGAAVKICPPACPCRRRCGRRPQPAAAAARSTLCAPAPTICSSRTTSTTRLVVPHEGYQRGKSTMWYRPRCLHIALLVHLPVGCLGLA